MEGFVACKKFSKENLGSILFVLLLGFFKWSHFKKRIIQLPF